jgi:hypothetical protein
LDPYIYAQRVSVRASVESVAAAEAKRRGQAAFDAAARANAPGASIVRPSGRTAPEQAAEDARMRWRPGGGGGGGGNEDELAQNAFLSRYAADELDVEAARRQTRRARLRSYTAEFTGHCEDGALCVLTGAAAALAPLVRVTRAAGAAAAALGTAVRSGGNCGGGNCGGGRAGRAW